MEIYLNHLNSGVEQYEIGEDYIKIKFYDGKMFTYSYQKAGTIHVENMKELALRGRGLCTYINQNTKYLYD